MAIGEQVWFVPFDNASGTLQNAFDPAPADRMITDAQAFTISLDTVMIPKQHVQQGLLPHLVRLLHGDFNILIASTTAVGTQPGVKRVHYFGPSGQFELPFTSFISDTIYLTSDFHPLNDIFLTLQVAATDTGTNARAGLLQAFNGLANQAGAVFPVVLQYSSVVEGVATAANKILDDLVPQESTRILDVIKLCPAGERDDIDLQEGRYVIVDKERDLTTCSVGADGKLLSGGKEVLDFPYIVFRVERHQAPSPDFVVSQQVATLLTQLNGSQNDPMKSSIEFVSDTLKIYSNFRNLQRYTDLLKKKTADPNSLTDADKAVMDRIKANPDLRDFLPQ
jgi:hypothetical protein